MNIVVVVSGGLTQTLQAAPLVAALGGERDTHVLLACPPSAAALADGLEGAEEILLMRGLSGRPGATHLGPLWRELRRRRLDAAFVCSAEPAVRGVVFLAAVPRRIGCPGGSSDRLLTDRLGCGPDANRACSWRRLATLLQRSTVPPAHPYALSEVATVNAERLLLGADVGDGRLLVAIAPGRGFADGQVRTWSNDRFAHLANHLAARHGSGAVLVGDESDRAAAEAVRLDVAAGVLDLCGEIDLPTTAAVIARCDLLVASDTPLLHLAAAVGTPSVGLFGPTDGRVHAPCGDEHRVVQALPAGTGAGGLDRIRVDDVLAGIESAL